jgi:hypothetical protein
MEDVMANRLAPRRAGYAIAALWLVAVAAGAYSWEAGAVELEDVSGQWVLVSRNGDPVAAKPEVFFRLEDGMLSGYDGCNRFAGQLSRPEAIRASGRGCPPDQPPFPLDLSRPAEHLAEARREADRLVLPLGGGGEAVFLLRQK